MAEVILMIFEGEKTEHQIFKNLNNSLHEIIQNIYQNNKPIIVSFGAEIYQLWRTLKEDGDLDIIEIMRERSLKNRQSLTEIKRDNVAQIYLFFDYDGHATNASDQDIDSMLKYFNNETESGALYISYPMVEAIKHIEEGASYKDAFTSAREITGKSYKHHISKISLHPNLGKLTSDDWTHIIRENLKKANLIIKNKYEIPSHYQHLQHLNQQNIFTHQIERYIKTENIIAVLSAFPLFIVEYFGENEFQFRIKNQEKPN